MRYLAPAGHGLWHVIEGRAITPPVSREEAEAALAAPPGKAPPNLRLVGKTEPALRDWGNHSVG